jgi:FkbM family methyltransferase
LYKAARGEQASGNMRINGEANLQRCVVDAVPASDALCFLDVGANHGEWTFMLVDRLSAAGRAARSYRIDLFEPVPATADSLAAKLAGRELSNIRLNRFALSDAEGEVEMAVMSATGGTNTIHFEGGEQAPPGGWVTVGTRTVSSYCDENGIGRVHLAKCDTEGHDLSVLRGARPMLEAGRIDVLQFEYNHRWVFSRSYLRDVFKLVEGLNYSVARVDPESIEVFDEWHEELERFFQSNYVLVKQEALSWFKVRRGAFGASNTYLHAR